MAYKYQQNMFSGASEGYVQYNITPDFGTRLLPGDTVKITGKFYARDFKVYGLSAETLYGPDSFSLVSLGTVAKTANKGVSATFSLTCTIPERVVNLSEERGFASYLQFTLHDASDFSSGTILTANSNQKLQILKNRIAPEITAVSLADTSGAFDHFGVYIRKKSNLTLNASYQTDPLDPSVLPETLHVQIGDIVVSPTEIVFENGTVRAVLGTFDITTAQDALVVGVTDNKGMTGTIEGDPVVFADYTPPAFVDLGATSPVERYSVSLDDNGNEVVAQDDAGEFLRCTFGGSVCAVNGMNAWVLSMGFALADEEITFHEVRAAADGEAFEYVQDQTLIPRTYIFSAARRYVVEFRVSDFFETAVLRVTVDKAGGYFHVEKYGVGVGMRTTATEDHKKFEVAPEYNTHFYGNVYDGKGNKCAGEPVWQSLPVDTTVATLADTQGCEFCKVGNVVWIVGGVKLVNRLASGTNLTIATLPEGYRPHRNTYEMHALGGSAFRLGALTTGEIVVIHYNEDAYLSNSYSLPLKIEYVAEWV